MARSNWMTALFAIDYALLFLLFNKGASAAGLPFFLGGTSNHFRVAALRALGGWDAYNVTEDADLGLRLARCGYVARTMASRTYEEAPDHFATLVAQRSRWMKGWMQTALVHCRDPSRLVADLGPARRARRHWPCSSAACWRRCTARCSPARSILDAVYGRLLRPETLERGFLLLPVVLCGRDGRLCRDRLAAPRHAARRPARPVAGAAVAAPLVADADARRLARLARLVDQTVPLG